MTCDLPPPATYLPFEKGSYDVLPGLRPFGEDFGNATADAQIFQIDSQFPAYRSAKLEARREQIGRHVLFHRFSEQTAAGVVRFVTTRLVDEHPSWFTLDSSGEFHRLMCRLTDEELCFDRNWRLVAGGLRNVVQPAYPCALDALACQVQEDLAVTCADEAGNWVAALHVCLPSHWRPEEKPGLDFAAVHTPVPGMEPFTRVQEKFVGKMLSATSGLVRFVWGLQWNDTLNRHPDRCSPAERFDREAENAFVRVERQTIWGLPESRASLFTIRPYLMNAREIKHRGELAAAMASAVGSMSEASLRYKGLARDRDAFLEWLFECAPETQLPLPQRTFQT